MYLFIGSIRLFLFIGPVQPVHFFIGPSLWKRIEKEKKKCLFCRQVRKLDFILQGQVRTSDQSRAKKENLWEYFSGKWIKIFENSFCIFYYISKKNWFLQWWNKVGCPHQTCSAEMVLFLHISKVITKVILYQSHLKSKYNVLNSNI